MNAILRSFFPSNYLFMADSAIESIIYFFCLLTSLSTLYIFCLGPILLQCRSAMNRQSREHTPTEAQIERPRIQEKRLAVSCRVDGRGSCRERVRCWGCVRNVSLCASLSGERWLAVMEDDGNVANVEEEGISSKETDALKAMALGLESVVIQQGLVGGLPTPISN